MESTERRQMTQVRTPFYAGPARSWPFYSHREEMTGHTFSNLYPCPVRVDTNRLLPGTDGERLLSHPDGEVTFASTEHVFQCAKALHVWDDLFCRELSSNAVARCGQGRFKFSSRERKRYVELGGEVIARGTGKKKKWIIAPDRRYARRESWAEIKQAVMWLALEAKFSQHPELWGERLEDEVPSLLIEHTRNDTQWGDAGDGSGTNLLGKMLSALLWTQRTGEPVDPGSDSMQAWLLRPNLETCPAFYEE